MTFNPRNVDPDALDDLIARVERAEREKAERERAIRDVASRASQRLKQYGLDADDPEFIGILRDEYTTAEAFENTVSDYVIDKLHDPNREPSAAEPEEETPDIGNITDSRELYRMEFSQMMGKPRAESRVESVETPANVDISKIEDSRTLYDLHFNQTMKGGKK